MSVLRVGTRASALALWQTHRVCEALARRQRDTAIVEISTTGDIHAEETVVFLHTGGMPALFTEDFVKAMGPGIT